jgi:hypothetical protein
VEEGSDAQWKQVLMLNGRRFWCSMEEGSDAQWKKVLILNGAGSDGRRF